MKRTISAFALSTIFVVLFIGCSASDSPKPASQSSGEGMMKGDKMMSDDGMKMSTMKDDGMMKDSKKE